MENLQPFNYTVIDREKDLKREFKQFPPVVVQIKQLTELFKSLDFDWSDLDFEKFLEVLTSTDVVSRFLAIILTEDGVGIRNKTLNELTDFFEFNADKDLIFKAIKDFFALNDILNLFRNIQKELPEIQGQMSSMKAGLK